MDLQHDSKSAYRAVDKDNDISIERSGPQGDLESIYFRFRLPGCPAREVTLSTTFEQDMVEKDNNGETVRVAIWRKIKIPTTSFRICFSNYIFDNNIDEEDFKSYIIKYLDLYLQKAYCARNVKISFVK
jgi:hypothetical protein